MRFARSFGGILLFLQLKVRNRSHLFVGLPFRSKAYTRPFPSGTPLFGRLLNWMGRRAISEFQVKQTAYPNAGRSWYIVGRPGGKRIRAWFDTKLLAEAEAEQRNLLIQRFGLRKKKGQVKSHRFGVCRRSELGVSIRDI